MTFFQADHQEDVSQDGLCRLRIKDLFILKSLPTHYLDGLSNTTSGKARLESYRKRRHPIEPLSEICNLAMNESLSTNGPGLSFSMCSPDLGSVSDANTAFILNIIELLQSLSLSTSACPIRTSRRVIYLASSSRSRVARHMLIVLLLTVLGQSFMHTSILSRIRPTRQLPKPRYDACRSSWTSLIKATLNYLHAHLSHPPMAKAFLYPSMPSTPKALVNLFRVAQDHRRHMRARLRDDVSSVLSMVRH